MVKQYHAERRRHLRTDLIEGAGRRPALTAKLRPMRLAGAMFLALGFPWYGEAKAAGFATFDPPGSTDTYANAINRAGAIAGYYFDAKASTASCGRLMA